MTRLRKKNTCACLSKSLTSYYARKLIFKLLDIEISHFRGFTEIQKIEFADHLTIVNGQNGYGKSSLSEAIEWLFYGYTQRRKHGDSIKKRSIKTPMPMCMAVPRCKYQLK
ncbi:ATP-binding protein [Candidatus Liberibacter asiaticus]|uniref:Rad50/SbcC-type AAA domain-containing protein n=2 Tax=Liberibacter asiaticus TaxID=34021 RepID=C6XFG0_LIBAP|nr:ATP-binding protein [Candidatus Liberibacter asiaticus]ACT57113.1 hypothetical protein CLIBASIA_02635 [Candidatus Liberibacter asiaticus str. psy62]AGH16922.1 hypothetical protein WSI_02760 [Candidatus Liberibacter asiaticus str. gxpsy]ALK07265.1 AAA family ATPase [Candidatus Liberibacter asiaticus]ASK52753.1 hypothetical protein B2I23_02825 [Candidatus Liberibacter asiaticus]AWL14074.1 hypothetical protein DIC79_02850 [Candidatus Liberibacter asiaticus]